MKLRFNNRVLDTKTLVIFEIRCKESIRINDTSLVYRINQSEIFYFISKNVNAPANDIFCVFFRDSRIEMTKSRKFEVKKNLLIHMLDFIIKCPPTNVLT